MESIKFPHGVTRNSMLRNGRITTTGVCARIFADTVSIEAITSRDTVATGEIAVPFDHETLSALERTFRKLAGEALQREQAATNAFPTVDQLRNSARGMYGTDDIEIDDDANISEADIGSWVQAFVWVPRAEVIGRPTPESALAAAQIETCIYCGDSDDLSKDNRYEGAQDVGCGCGATWTEHSDPALSDDDAVVTRVVINHIPNQPADEAESEAA